MEVQLNTKLLCDQIFSQENIKECLNIRLYHLQHKCFQDSYESNENRLKILQTQERLGFVNYRLSIMYDELDLLFKNIHLDLLQKI